MRRIALALLFVLIAVLLAYRVAMPFTPLWIDLAFIGLCAVFLLVARVITRRRESKKVEQKPSSD